MLRIAITITLYAAGTVFAGVGRLSMPPAEATQRVESLRSQLARDPAGADSWTELAWLLYRYEQDTAGALEASERACRLKPDGFKAHEIAGRLEFLRGREERALAHWLRLLDGDRPETRMYLTAVGSLARTQDQRELVRERLSEVADNHPNALFQTIARRYLAQAALAGGKLDEARALYATAGVIDRWMIIGPFNNERDAGYNIEYGPEMEIDIDGQYPGRNQEVSWRALEQLTFDGYVDFGAVCYPREQVLGYALTFVHSPEERNVTLRLGVSGSVKVWFNERLVYESELERGFAPDQETVRLRMHAGYNKLLVKMGTESGEWSLAARLTDPSGRPLRGLKYSTKFQSTPDDRGRDEPEFVYTPSMMDHFERVVRVDPDNQDALYYLGIAQQANRLETEASKTFERLADLNGRCADHQRLLARSYLRDDQAEKALAALKRGIELDPDDLQLRLMLARFYNSRRLYQKEREVLTAIEQRHPGWWRLHFRWIDNYQSEGWEELAFRRLRELYDSAPTDLQILAAYARACAARGFSDDVERLIGQILALDQSSAFALRERLTRAVAQQRHGEAFEVYDLLHRLNPTEYNLRLDRADLLMSLKRYEEALEQCRLALEVCPADFSIHHRMGVIRQRMHDDASALEAFKAALSYRPDHRALRQYVEYLQPDENAAFVHYALSGDDIEALLAREVTGNRYPKSDAVFLLDEMITQVFDDGSSTYRIHQMVKVLDASGREQWNRVALPEGSNKVTRAVVMQPGGDEVEAARITNSAIDFAQLQPGAIIDYVVTGYAPANDWISHHYSETFVFQSDDPMILSRFVVLSSEAKPISRWHQGDGVEYRCEEFQGETVHIWEARDTARVHGEPHAPPFMDLAAQVRVSTIRDWEEIATWEHSLIKEQFEPDHELIATVREVAGGLETTSDKVRALADFVARDIQYKIVRGGIFGYKPNKAANVLHNQWGDCKDKATLLITMLEQIGIEARYATIRTRDGGRLIKEIPSNQCNHAIVYIPATAGLEEDLWVDATARDQGISALPWPCQNVTAMVWDGDGEMRMMQTPLEPAENTQSRFDLEVALDADGGADVAGRWTTTGQVAATLRDGFRRPGQRAERLTHILNGISPGSTLKDFAFSSLQERDRPVQIDMQFSAKAYAIARGAELIVRTTRPLQATAQFAPREQRYYDVWLPFREQITFAETFRPPPGYGFVGVPEPVELETPWMTYSVSVTANGDSVRTVREFVIKDVAVPREDYADLREFCIKVDEYENQFTLRAERMTNRSSN